MGLLPQGGSIGRTSQGLRHQCQIAHLYEIALDLQALPDFRPLAIVFPSFTPLFLNPNPSSACLLHLRVFLRLPRSANAMNRIFPLHSRPPCPKCRQPSIRAIVKDTNQHGNAGRPYYSCHSGHKTVFITWDDNEGVCNTNPCCWCRVPSRREEKNGPPPREAYYACSSKECGFRQDEMGQQIPKDDIPELYHRQTTQPRQSPSSGFTSNDYMSNGYQASPQRHELSSVPDWNSNHQGTNREAPLWSMPSSLTSSQESSYQAQGQGAPLYPGSTWNSGNDNTHRHTVSPMRYVVTTIITGQASVHRNAYVFQLMVKPT